MSPFRRSMTLLATYLRPQWKQTLVMAVLLLASIGLQLINPQILRYFIDTTVAHRLSSALVWSALLFLAISVLNQAASVVSAYLCEKVAWTATNQLRADLLAHILTLDLAFHKSHTPGELIERIDGDVNVLSNFFSRFIVHMLFHVLLLLGMLIALTYTNWILGITMGLYCLIVVVILTWMRRPSPARWVIADQARADFFGFLGESFTSIEDVRANGGMRYVWQRFYSRFQYWFSTTCYAGWSGGTPWIVSRTLFTLGGILGLVLGAYLWSIGLASPGTVYLIFTYTTLLMQPLDQIQWELRGFQQAEACIQRIDTLFKTTSTLRDGPGAMPEPGAVSITFEQVSFGYTDDNMTVHEVSFHLPEEHVLGIVGHTGAGKTTLARLLFRMQDPQAGVISLGGVPLTQMQLQDLRKRVSFITQDVQLFNATVRDNLTFFNYTISDETILAVLHDVGLQTWYETMPQGLETRMSSGGGGLSAGEAQLLAFARAFLNEPDVVMLDEASSRLDPVTEQVIERAVEKLFTRRTGIVIAHRLATIQRASDILVMENGRIIELGPRAALAADPTSHFARLLQQDSGAVHA